MDELIIKQTTTDTKPVMDRGVLTSKDGWYFYKNEESLIDEEIFKTKEQISKDIEKYENKTIASKDLVVGKNYSVRKLHEDIKGNTVTCEEIVTGTAIILSYKEYIESGNLSQPVFSVLVTSKRGDTYFASRREAQKQIDFFDLGEFKKNNTCFKVTITETIKNAGFFALYNNNVKVFLPGSLAAANIVKDFQSMIGKEVDVMVDNFDNLRSTYTVSAKKYIEFTAWDRAESLRFGELYEGVLTSDIGQYGAYIEIKDHFTGLLSPSELFNLEEAKKTMKSGSQVSVFIQDIENKRGLPRLHFTLDYGTINPNKLKLQGLRDALHGEKFPYNYYDETQTICPVDGNGEEIFQKRVNGRMVESLISQHKYVKISVNHLGGSDDLIDMIDVTLCD